MVCCLVQWRAADAGRAKPFGHRQPLQISLNEQNQILFAANRVELVTASLEHL
jgi:hypothetical protein